MRISKPKKPGELIGAMNRSKMSGKMDRMFKHKKRHHKVSPLTGLTEGSPKDMKMDAKIANRMDMVYMHKKPKLGSGKRFAALKAKLGKKGATNPGALAAYIGRKKFGAKKMASMAAKGRKHHKYGPSDSPKNAGKQNLNAKRKKMCKKAHKHGPSC